MNLSLNYMNQIAIMKLVSNGLSLLFHYSFYKYIQNIPEKCQEPNVYRNAVLQSTIVSFIVIIGRLLFTTFDRFPFIVVLFILHYEFISCLYTFLYLRKIKKDCLVNKTAYRIYYYYFGIFTYMFSVILLLTYYGLAL
jgi:hypothetical protein